MNIINNVWLCVFPVVRARARNRFLVRRFFQSFDYDYEHRPRRTEHEHDSAGDRTKSDLAIKYHRFIDDSAPEQIYREPRDASNLIRLISGAPKGIIAVEKTSDQWTVTSERQEKALTDHR
jgi:hypothetical protein